MQSQSQSKVKVTKEIKLDSIFSKSLLTRTISLPMQVIGSNLRDILEEKIRKSFEGKCEQEGFIKAGSSQIVTYTSGIITRGNMVVFDVAFEADICFPVEGSVLLCTVKNITKAGIRAESADAVPSPIVVFVAREHHNANSSLFSSVKVDDRIYVRVIGQRFELNDKFVSVIGDLIKNSTKPKLVIEE